MGQTIYEQTPWAFCLMWTLVRLYGATSVLMVTGRTGMERYVEQANMQPPVGIQVVQRLDAFQEGGHP